MSASSELSWRYFAVKGGGELQESCVRQTITTPEQLSLMQQSARKQRGLTQAEAAGFLNLSQASLSRLELNTQTMNVAQLLALCKRLGLELIVQEQGTVSSSAALAATNKADW
jgi:HTH-type transcriptional regulator/antitoxin HipB